LNHVPSFSSFRSFPIQGKQEFLHRIHQPSEWLDGVT
jgi:hypothetical protein